MSAAIWMAATAACTVPSDEFALPATAVGPLLYWIFITSMLGYSVLTAATKHLPATNVAAFICLQPLAGSAFAVTMLGEQLTRWDAGAGLIVAGLAVVLRDAAPPGGMKRNVIGLGGRASLSMSASVDAVAALLPRGLSSVSLASSAGWAHGGSPREAAGGHGDSLLWRGSLGEPAALPLVREGSAV